MTMFNSLTNRSILRYIYRHSYNYDNDCHSDAHGTKFSIILHLKLKFRNATGNKKPPCVSFIYHMLQDTNIFTIRAIVLSISL